MPDPLIAIVGSADPARSDYDPPLKHTDRVAAALEELGAELARAKYRIMVYSASPDYIEADVVRGYVASGVAEPGSIQVRYPQGQPQASDFPEASHDPKKVFQLLPDVNDNWEFSFYESLKESGGVLIIGGGGSARVTGVTARLLQLPVVAIATFGGSAANVWTVIKGNPAVSAEEHSLMGSPAWSPESAKGLVGALTKQRERIAQAQEVVREAALAEAGRVRKRALVAGAVFVATLASMALALATPGSVIRFGLLFILTPVLAGIAGGIARNVLDLFEGNSVPTGHGDAPGAVLGMIAGFVSAALFAVAQLTTRSDLGDLATKGIPWGVRLLTVFELVIALAAGLTVEQVFGKLRKTKIPEMPATPPG
jgi:hypothetical protein